MPVQAHHTFQSAATATGNGTALRVRGGDLVVVDVVISNTATVVAEGKIGDGGPWRTLRLRALVDGTYAASATASGHFAVDVRGMDEVRVRVSAYTSGTVTVAGRLVTAALDS